VSTVRYPSILFSPVPAVRVLEYCGSTLGGHCSCRVVVDVDACTARGIQVGHTPKAVDHATATTGSFLAISALRQFYRAEVNIRNGNWKRGLKPAHDPEDRVLGIIGMGGIGTVRTSTVTLRVQ
jgi:phosphoglycerate dehydrogenase-like enzyme